MIPKRIHYCWFGRNEMSPLQKACIKTWKKHLNDYEIICWDEDNSPLDIPFLSYHYKKQNWAFMSDYMRLYAIYNHGGIYLDTDFEILKNIDPLRVNKCFLGEEKPNRINDAICGGVKGHHFFKEALSFMERRHENNQEVLISPEVCTQVFNSLKKRKLISDIKIYTPDYFYPYNPFDEDPSKHFFLANYVSKNTYAIHHWCHSWKPSVLMRVFSKIKLFMKK